MRPEGPPASRPFMCPRCEKPASAIAAGSVICDGYNEHGVPVDLPSEYTLVQCSECGRPSVVVREDYGEGFSADEPIVVYPTPRRLNFTIPRELRREWDEARTCFDAKAYTACAVMVRRTLEGACRELGVRDKKTLAQSLEDLRTRGLIDETLAKWADALRITGNKGAHYTGESMSRQDAEDALDFAEALLDHIYVLRKKFDDFQSRLAKKG